MRKRFTLQDAVTVLHEYNRENPANLCHPFTSYYLYFNRENVHGLRKLLNRIWRHLHGSGACEADLTPGWKWDIFNVWDGYGYSDYTGDAILDYYDMEESLRVQYGVTDAVVRAAFWAYDLNYRGQHLLRYDWRDLCRAAEEEYFATEG